MLGDQLRVELLEVLALGAVEGAPGGHDVAVVVVLDALHLVVFGVLDVLYVWVGLLHLISTLLGCLSLLLAFQVFLVFFEVPLTLRLRIFWMWSRRFWSSVSDSEL